MQINHHQKLKKSFKQKHQEVIYIQENQIHPIEEKTVKELAQEEIKVIRENKCEKPKLIKIQQLI